LNPKIANFTQKFDRIEFYYFSNLIEIFVLNIIY